MDAQYSDADIQKLFRSHDQATSAFRAELAQRSAGEVQYDNYLLELPDAPRLKAAPKE